MLIVDDLIPVLSHEDAGLRGDTAGILGQIGSIKAAPALRKALQDPDADVREAVEEALALIDASEPGLDHRLCPEITGNFPQGARVGASRGRKLSEKKKDKKKSLCVPLALFLLPLFVRAYFGFVDLTSRKIWLNREYEYEVCRKRSFACASFHGVMLFPLYYCRRYHGLVMVSRSRDGEFISRSLQRINYKTIRRSVSAGGKEALEEMIDTIKQKDCSSGQAVDGPQGPAGVVKMGIVVMARETGPPIVPFVSWASRQVQFKSWDRMILPLPFSTIVMAFGRPTDGPTRAGP